MEELVLNYKVIIIGAGQLGSRHLQGALVSQHELDIFVVDPSKTALAISKKRVGEVGEVSPPKNVQYLTSIPSEMHFDVGIISTAAQYRAAVTNELLSSNDVDNIIFEKVLFQKLSEYDDVNILLSEKNTRAWVNCPRRIFPTYENIKRQLSSSSSGPINMSVSGRNWGMACNSVHFIDLFAFFINNNDIKVECSRLSQEVLSSKRTGYSEVKGELSFSSNNNLLTVKDVEDSSNGLTVSLSNGQITYVVNETNGVWLEKTLNEEVSREYKPVFQSQLTGICIDEIVASGKCGLTPFSDSCALHKPFISELLDHMSVGLDEKLIACPIT